MFDLFRSRATAVRYLIGAIMMLVALSMVITLVPGFMGASYSTGDPNIVAEIGDDVITVREVQSSLQQQLQNNQIPREMAANYVPMIVNQMIAENALAYQAERLGFEVSDADVAEAVHSMIPALFQDGQFVGEQAYAQYLSQMNLTIPQFERNVRKRMLLLKITSLALEGEIVTDEQIEEEFRNANEKVQIEFVTFAAADYRSQVKVSEDDVKAHYDANPATYRIGEQRDVRILVVDQDEVAGNIQIPDEELRKLYQAEADRFRTPERVRVRHILLKTTDKTDEQKKEARAKIDDLLAQLKGGADFAKLAEANSEDTGSAVEGGELGWIARGQTVANFEKAAFSLQPKTISDVIETEYGYHVLEVMEKETARLQPFEVVKNQLAEEKKRQYVYDRIQQLADEARAELVKTPDQPEAVAAKLGLSVLTVDKVGATDPVPEASPDMRAEFMGIEVGEVTQIYEVGQDRLGIATVTAIYPERQAELSEVRDQIRQQLITEKANALYQEKRQLIANVVTAAEGDLKKIASSIGAKIQTSEEITRSGTVEGFGGAVYISDIFDAEVGDVVGPADAMGRTIVAKVVKKTPADLTLLAVERTDILDQLQARRARERRELFEDGVVAQLINEGKLKKYDETIQRLLTVFTG